MPPLIKPVNPSSSLMGRYEFHTHTCQVPLAAIICCMVLFILLDLLNQHTWTGSSIIIHKKISKPKLRFLDSLKIFQIPVFQQLNTRMLIFIQSHLINSQNELSSTLSHKIKDPTIQGVMLKT